MRMINGVLRRSRQSGVYFLTESYLRRGYDNRWWRKLDIIKAVRA